MKKILHISFATIVVLVFTCVVKLKKVNSARAQVINPSTENGDWYDSGPKKYVECKSSGGGFIGICMAENRLKCETDKDVLII